MTEAVTKLVSVRIHWSLIVVQESYIFIVGWFRLISYRLCLEQTDRKGLRSRLTKGAFKMSGSICFANLSASFSGITLILVL